MARKPKADRESTPRKSQVRAAAARMTSPSELCLDLYAPGMTPMLRAGLGGLAASLRAILLEDNPEADWPSPVPLDGGEAVVEPTQVRVRFNSADPESVLSTLFSRSFVIQKPSGLIHLPGAFDPLITRNTALCVALQNGLKRTFLQHGKSTAKAGPPTTREVELDDRKAQVIYQPYASFAHQGAFSNVLDAMRRGDVQLAGWAYPGNAGRHNGFAADTDWRYGPTQALAAIFAIVGCLSFDVPRSGGAGALIVVEPSDLIEYAITRVHLTPRSLTEAYLSGTGDAVLAVHMRLRAERAQHAPGVAAVHGVTLRATPWASQQKSRVATVSMETADLATLDLYDLVVRSLPTKILDAKAVESAEDGTAESGFYPATSALRAFVTDNIARGRRWFEGFATATTEGKKPRFLHYYRSPDAKNLGALYPDEREGLIAMTEHLQEAEVALVRSVHQAIRGRFARISEDTKNLPLQTRKNRWNAERERWRLAFAGSKTPEQIRSHLADLWSRAGRVGELQEKWEQVLPLLRPENWQTARDLALVALASYAKAKEEEELESVATDEQGEE